MNSVCVQLTLAPPVSPVSVTVTPGVVRAPPAANCKPAWVPIWRYGADVLPRKVADVGSAVQPGAEDVAQYVTVSGEVEAFPPAGVKDTWPFGTALT